MRETLLAAEDQGSETYRGEARSVTRVTHLLLPIARRIHYVEGHVQAETVSEKDPEGERGDHIDLRNQNFNL